MTAEDSSPFARSAHRAELDGKSRGGNFEGSARAEPERKMCLTEARRRLVEKEIAMRKIIKILIDDAEFKAERNSVVFPAIVDGERRLCLVTAAILMDRFGAGGYGQVQLQNALSQHVNEIKAMASQVIESIPDQAEYIIGTTGS
jgi:hypothetical protein